MALHKPKAQTSSGILYVLIKNLYLVGRINCVIGWVFCIKACTVCNSLLLDLNGLNGHAWACQGLAVVVEAVGVLGMFQMSSPPKI